MAKTPTSEFFSTLKTYFNQLSDGERTPTEVATALNGWARESAESIKAKISEEVEATVSKMGFVKQEEYDALLQRVAKLEENSAKKSSVKTSPKSTAKSPTKAPLKSSARTSTKKSSEENVKKRTTKKASK
jgi:BMFP domain-containing protein YqiC